MIDETDLPTWAGLDAIAPLCGRLQHYNDWRRGSNSPQPRPKDIGEDLDEAIRLLTAMAVAIRTTLDDNLNMADGDVCTLIHIKRVAEKS